MEVQTLGPAYKKDDRNAKENYRPITLLPCVSKVLEKLVGAQINSGFSNCIYQSSQLQNNIVQFSRRLETCKRSKTGCKHTFNWHVKGIWLITPTTTSEQARSVWFSRKRYSTLKQLLKWTEISSKDRSSCKFQLIHESWLSSGFRTWPVVIECFPE